MKPRFGRASRDVFEVDDETEIPWILRRVPEPIAQTRLSGREFTAGALVDRSGLLAACVPRWRLEAKAGISTKGETFVDPELDACVARLLDGLGLTGPASVQGFVHEDGSFSIVEVNPRFSGGLALSLAAGADLVGEYVSGILGLPLDPDHLTYKPGVIMTRHFVEVFI